MQLVTCIIPNIALRLTGLQARSALHIKKKRQALLNQQHGTLSQPLMHAQEQLLKIKKIKSFQLKIWFSFILGIKFKKTNRAKETKNQSI